MTWQPISTAPKDGTEIMVGKYYVDNAGGYWGPSQWLWIVMGSYDEEGFFDHFNDEIIPHNHMVYAREATHWRPLLEPPQE